MHTVDPDRPWLGPRPFLVGDDYIEFLQRALCASTREHQRVKSELALTRNAFGLNKPFPFLRLPREIRDKIYTYALQAPSSVDPEPRLIERLSLEDNPSKPPTSALCLVNKRVGREAAKILYASNTFFFAVPHALLRFEEQIGVINRDLIRSLEIRIIILTESSQAHIQNPDLLTSSDWGSYPSHWERGLLRSSLRKVVNLTITGCEISSWNCVFMAPILKQGIEGFFDRDQGKRTKLRLMLRGFAAAEKDKFTDTWHVRTEQWTEESWRKWDCGA